MTNINFITGNPNKLRELQAVIPQLVMHDIDLPEIQSLDPKEIIIHKLRAARTQTDQPVIVEDTSLAFNCLSGLPGPLVKWFLKTVQTQGIYKMVENHKDHTANATVMIGLAHGTQTQFFEGSIEGVIVAPRGNNDFGWGPIFQPHGSTKTFAET